jgi:hypothetical protein
MRLRRNPAATKRRGIILLVVLVMLTLFAIAGLTFVLYADAAAESARFNQGAETLLSAGGPDMDPSASLNLFLGQLIYGVSDSDGFGCYSALRGHSLAETMYGSYDGQPQIGTNFVPMDVCYNGTGALHEPGLFAGTDGYSMVNYTYFAADGFLRDPSRIGTRANLAAPRSPYTGGQNAPYTYPDRNSLFLASIVAQPDPVTGQVKVAMPSYLRPWMFNSDPNPWASPEGKYMTLRPRPAENPGFPMPDPATGYDVQNLPNGAGPDSIWIDINAPILTTASGLKYKMLVAPLIVDLDNRINLNVAGNVFAEAQANRHAGNQRWGHWEVNMSKVLNANAAEWQNLFLGNGTVYGRYGPTGLPTAIFPFPPNAASPHVYAPGDLNSVIDPGQAGQFTASPLYLLPSNNPPNAVPYQCFPYFAPQAYGNDAGGLELKNAAGQTAHPMFYNPLLGSAGNIIFPIDSHAKLMWAGIPASPTSPLVQLAPNNLSALPANAANSRRVINETTVLSMDLERPGAVPYVYDPTAAPYTVNFNPLTNVYTFSGSPQNFPPLANRLAGPPPANSEFSAATWQSILPGALSRADLGRLLTPYTVNAAQADADRKQFANDIFTRLLAVTGTTYYYSNIGNAAITGPQQYNSLRWLAQLSVNMVDYIDSDDIMTGFQWTGTPQAPDTGWVFGTELPKLTVNEVYLQYQNDPTDPFTGAKATKPYQMNVWAELVNPLPSGADLNGSNQAVLQDANGVPVYQLVLTKPNQGIRNPDNIIGSPDGPTPPNAPYATQPYTPSGQYVSVGGSQILQLVNNWGASPQVVQPMGANFGNGASASAGFFVVGPPTAVAGLPAATLQSPNMTYAVPLADPTANTPVAPTLLLQRLANPTIAFNNVPGPGYNPYVTVDYVDLNPLAAGGPPPINPAVNDARTFSILGPIVGAPMPPYTTFQSFGRNEPYASLCFSRTNTQWLPQRRNPVSTTGPQNSFFQQNVNVNTPGPNDASQVGFAPPANYPPFDWLVHLDRPPISPVELLHVSAFKPHELTQQFIDATGSKPDITGHGHYAPWADATASSHLFRLLEFVRMKGSTPFFPTGGRIPGKVNINTLDASINPITGLPNSVEVFRALSDAEPGNRFYYDAAGNPVGDTYVDAAFGALMAARTPGGTPGPNDHPFWGLAQGPYAAGDIQYPNNGIIWPAAAVGAGGVPGATNPYQKLELINKLFNGVTTRSNVFAVWLTVGFFQVTNDTTTPVQLGPEINAAQGRAIRHHMFAIVDRTQIRTFSTTTTGVAAGPGPINVPATVTDARTNRTWQIAPGTQLVYDPDTLNEETVVVQAGGVATFTLAHPAGATVIDRGNPGPWTLPVPGGYDPSQDGLVVPYLVIID